MANSANAMVLMIYFSNFRQLTINEDIENNKYLYSSSQCDYDARWKSILKKHVEAIHAVNVIINLQ